MADPGQPFAAPVGGLADLVAAKADRKVVVCIPARDEAATVGAVVRTVVQEHLARHGGSGLVDQVLVVDDGSRDRTGDEARSAGADVVRRVDDAGKGQAMRTALAETTGELVVFLDADVSDMTGAFVSGLLRPLLLDAGTSLVKACYTRPLGGSPTGGGRVNELVARPILRLLFPELAEIRQPLAGETAAWRTVLDKIALDGDYGVEMGLLIDVASIFGAGTIAQVDLGVRTHRNRTLAELRPQAEQVLRAALRRAGIPPFPSPPDP